MDGMDLLERCRRTLADLRELDDRERRIRESAVNLVPSYDKTGGGHGSQSDISAEFMAEIDAIERERSIVERLYVAELTCANKALNEIPAGSREVLFRVYIMNEKIMEVCEHVDRTKSTVLRLKAEGVRLMKAMRVNMPDGYAESAKAVRRMGGLK